MTGGRISKTPAAMSKTYAGAVKDAARILAQAGIAEADLEAKLLAEYVCGTRRTDYYAHPERELSGEEEERFDALCARRAAERIPLAYLTGTQEFFGLSFAVTKDVLIPRQDTETLVEEARAHLHDGMRFLDLGTGSGCVALSLAYYTNDTTGVATDISGEAVAVAKENAERLGIDRVRFTVCDLFPEREEAPFDLIVSNPPYIRTKEIDELQQEVSLHEPISALDGGADGLFFYRKILEKAPDYLTRGGYLLTEIGYDQAKEVSALFEEAHFKHVCVVQDDAANPRVVKGCYYV